MRGTYDDIRKRYGGDAARSVWESAKKVAGGRRNLGRILRGVMIGGPIIGGIITAGIEVFSPGELGTGELPGGPGSAEPTRAPRRGPWFPPGPERERVQFPERRVEELPPGSARRERIERLSGIELPKGLKRVPVPDPFIETAKRRIEEYRRKPPPPAPIGPPAPAQKPARRGRAQRLGTILGPLIGPAILQRLQRRPSVTQTVSLPSPFAPGDAIGTPPGTGVGSIPGFTVIGAVAPFTSPLTAARTTGVGCSCTPKKRGPKRKCLERGTVAWKTGRYKGRAAGSKCIRYAN